MATQIKKATALPREPNPMAAKARENAVIGNSQFADRFWSKVRRGEGCWEWQAAKADGYGCVSIGHPHMARAHRVAWVLTRGPIAPGIDVLHKCDNPPCCNPSHLFLGTQADNNADMASKGRANNQNAGKTHCKRGHEFTPENTREWTDRDGYDHRTCRTCFRVLHRAWETKTRARNRLVQPHLFVL